MTLNKRGIRSLILTIVIGLVLAGLAPMLWEFLMQQRLSSANYEKIFNILFLAVALVFSFIFLVLYPVIRSKYAGPFEYYVKYLSPLAGAFFLILFASALFDLYDNLHNIFLEMYGLTPEEKAVVTRLTENLNILRLVVPAVMLGVAANLITIFLHSLESNGDKSPPL